MSVENHGRKTESVEDCFIVECPECGKQAAFKPPTAKGVKPPECSWCDERMITLPDRES